MSSAASSRWCWEREVCHPEPVDRSLTLAEHAVHPPPRIVLAMSTQLVTLADDRVTGGCVTVVTMTVIQ
jgi:hypothetical protein